MGKQGDDLSVIIENVSPHLAIYNVLIYLLNNFTSKPTEELKPRTTVGDENMQWNQENV